MESRTDFTRHFVILLRLKDIHIAGPMKDVYMYAQTDTGSFWALLSLSCFSFISQGSKSYVQQRK